MKVIGKYMFEANMVEQGTKCGPRFVSWNISITNYDESCHLLHAKWQSAATCCRTKIVKKCT